MAKKNVIRGKNWPVNCVFGAEKNYDTNEGAPSAFLRGGWGALIVSDYLIYFNYSNQIILIIFKKNQYLCFPYGYQNIFT